MELATLTILKLEVTAVVSFTIKELYETDLDFANSWELCQNNQQTQGFRIHAEFLFKDKRLHSTDLSQTAINREVCARGLSAQLEERN